MHDATKSPSNPEEEFQISQDKGAIIEAIDALFALADDSNVCLKCGESGHPNYECPTKGGEQVKSALINLRKKLQGDDVEDKEMSKEDDGEGQDRFRQENYKATREGEYMYLQSIPLSVIGDRAHGEKSINGVKADEKGPMTKGELNQIVDTASQKGITITCKEMRSAMAHSDHKMYKKLMIGTDIGKLKILPVNGGKFYSNGYAGHGVEFPLPTESNANRVHLENWENNYSYYFNKALRHHIGRKDVWEKTKGGKKTMFSGLKCDEAGWMDIMDFLHHPWIFDHENVRVEDDGLIDVDYREDRVNTMIKTVWSEFQEKNKVRIQFLCIVLDSTFDKPDEYLRNDRNVMKVGDDIHKLIAQRGEVFLAPIAVRSPGGFSAQGNDFRLDYGRICHPITTRIVDDLCFCYHVTEFNTVLRVSKAMLNEIDIEDNIPFYDQFVKDIEKLEKANGVLSPGSELRNSIVTFISENYTPREAGHLICPACLTETPNILSICIRCHGSLLSWGGRQQSKTIAPPWACQNVNVKKAEMALMTTTRMSRWRTRTKMRLIDWSGSPREQQEVSPIMTST